jgi:hypothetical protein
VIRFVMPLPVGNSIALSGFLAEMKRAEGDSRLISKTPLSDAAGNRLASSPRGGRYHTNGIIRTRGTGRMGNICRNPCGPGRSRLDEISLAVHAQGQYDSGLVVGAKIKLLGFQRQVTSVTLSSGFRDREPNRPPVVCVGTRRWHSVESIFRGPSAVRSDLSDGLPTHAIVSTARLIQHQAMVDPSA